MNTVSVLILGLNLAYSKNLPGVPKNARGLF